MSKIVEISFEHVSYRRGPTSGAVSVLDDFTWQADEFPLALIGPNGAGKSTIFGLTAGVLRVRSGSVKLVDSAGQTYDSVRDRRRMVGIVAQQSVGIRGLSVRELVAYASWVRGSSRTSAWDKSKLALATLNLEDVGGRPSTALSGGQARRMTIAMAIASDPAVLLLDEATAGLDPIERSVLLDLVAEISNRVPVIASTHEVDDLGLRYDSVTVLSDGTVQFQGATQSFLDLAPGGRDNSSRAVAAYAQVLSSVGPGY